MRQRPRTSGSSLGKRLVICARRNWNRRCISDSSGCRLTYGQTLTAGLVLAAVIKKLTANHEKIGILLPPSTAATIANIAAVLAGKVPVNLNYIVSRQYLDNAVRQCRIKSIISSRSFMKKLAHLDSLEGMLFIEDLRAEITTFQKVRAYLMARFFPRRSIVPPHAGGDLAAVLFSSGSTGTPKGVMLSHDCILSNIDALVSVFALKPNDNLCGVLPFFHSFGFTCSLWLPMISAVSAAYAHDPLNCDIVGRLARQNRSTVLFTAPTFLVHYTRRIEPESFAHLRAVVVGAEKLKKPVADAFERKFGIRPQAGYGATELSPVVSLNITDSQTTGRNRAAYKEGTVGKAIPGIELKIVELETHQALAPGSEGLLLVKSPSVMIGYLNDQTETARVLVNGWYNTGDIAAVDEQGFLTITDRLSRFSKIAGEMIPHPAVEQVYLNALRTDRQLVAVTAVPAGKKGEELVVLYLPEAGRADYLHEIITASDIPNIWKPRKGNYIRIESMPSLGSGKLDIRRLRQIALDSMCRK